MRVCVCVCARAGKQACAPRSRLTRRRQPSGRRVRLAHLRLTTVNVLGGPHAADDRCGVAWGATSATHTPHWGGGGLSWCGRTMATTTCAFPSLPPWRAVVAACVLAVPGVGWVRGLVGAVSACDDVAAAPAGVLAPGGRRAPSALLTGMGRNGKAAGFRSCLPAARPVVLLLPSLHTG